MVNADGTRWFRGELIFPKNRYGMYSARVDVPGGGVSLAADTLIGMKDLIREAKKGNIR